MQEEHGLTSTANSVRSPPEDGGKGLHAEDLQSEQTKQDRLHHDSSELQQEAAEEPRRH